VARELTKRFEEVRRGTLGELAAEIAGREVKGEVVVLADRAPVTAPEAASVEEALDKAMQTMTLKDAAAAVAEAFGLPRREVYQIALRRGDA
jgi:16S rRNA (cytidine1402-2'-O)-methyltransferase